MAHIRIVRFQLNEANRSKAQAMGDNVVAAIRQQPGLEGVWFASDPFGETALVVLWADKEHADAASVHISPVLMGHIGEMTTRPPDIQLLPVIAS